MKLLCITLLALLIRNISETGALLELQSPALIPDDFSLLIKTELTRRQCRVIWRAPLRLGVKFVS
ncbi:MAG: PilZ domain-containing protein [Pseudolabrys sp.]